MSSLTELLIQLLNKKLSFARLMKKREICERIDAKIFMEVAIRNLKKKKDINSQQLQELKNIGST
ncbi:hypothetical protein K501DRAFT_196316 [Backusella circina FSU 941]|nr:hypothetical protein K501DRAFT_197171 [Backusella circina FSU 941]KAI8878227.1 hypothetical protein K501DRAFT_196316 [Backusella circina FSU 941]